MYVELVLTMHTILTNTKVIHTQVLEFHDTFNKANSLDQMIQLHDEQSVFLNSSNVIYSSPPVLRGYAAGVFCRPMCVAVPRPQWMLTTIKTSALHRAIISVLDMSLQFCEIFVTFAGNTTVTHDVSRQSIISKRHRSRRQRAQRKNVVSFSQALQESDESSEDDEVDLDGQDEGQTSFSMAASSISSVDDGYSRIDKMSSELDGLVRFIRRGVESLAGGTGHAASSFSVLSFTLEDWDL